jgi:Ras-related protein Rab-7A
MSVTCPKSLVYDVTDPRTLDSLAEWKSEFIEQVGTEEEEDFAFIVVGNKVDLEAARQVTRSKGEQVAREIGALAHFETSAKTAHNVEKAFHSAASNALQRNAQRKLYIVYVSEKLDH